MTQVTMYTKTFCGYCMAAKRFLKNRGIEFEEINIQSDPDLRREMLDRAEGRFTVPQIFIDDQAVGGYTELRALGHSGELDQLLAASRENGEYHSPS